MKIKIFILIIFVSASNFKLMSMKQKVNLFASEKVKLAVFKPVFIASVKNCKNYEDCKKAIKEILDLTRVSKNFNASINFVLKKIKQDLIAFRFADVDLAFKFAVLNLILDQVESDFLAFLEQLYINNCDIENLKKEYGNLTLHIALIFNYYNILQLSIDHKLGLDYQDEFQRNALMWVCYNGYLSFARILVENGIDVNVKDKFGRNALMYSIESEKYIVAKYLISKKLNVNSKTNNGKTALMFAVILGFIDLAKLLIDNFADINAKDKEGKSALIYAVLNNDSQIAKMLIDAGVDIDVTDSFDKTALSYALEKNSDKLIDLISKTKSEISKRGSF